MANLVVVAIPAKDDYVWRISSERVPHLTLLFLGSALNPRIPRMKDFIEHAMDMMLDRFGLDVDRRGILGVDEADVLFFSRDYFSRDIENFRSTLLQNADIKAAYESTAQFDEWTPHLTLGYPDTPARSDPRDYPGIHYVHFDRIALWYGDYSGAEFELKSQSALDIAMSAIKHHGIKGMKWGIRRSNPSAGSSVVVKTTAGKKVKTTGGKGLRPSDDAVRAAIARQKAKKSGVDSLSNDELRILVSRMGLERQLSTLRTQNSGNSGKRILADVLVNVGKQQVSRLANEAATKSVDSLIRR